LVLRNPGPVKTTSLSFREDRLKPHDIKIFAASETTACSSDRTEICVSYSIENTAFGFHAMVSHWQGDFLTTSQPRQGIQ
jgi:hypothetical protein